MTLLGDLPLTSGDVQVRGRVAYVPQQPWLVTDTLEENILMGRPKNVIRYSRVIKACELHQVSNDQDQGIIGTYNIYYSVFMCSLSIDLNLNFILFNFISNFYYNITINTNLLLISGSVARAYWTMWSSSDSVSYLLIIGYSCHASRRPDRHWWTRPDTERRTESQN